MTPENTRHANNILKFVLEKQKPVPIYDPDINAEFKSRFLCNLSEAYGLVGNDLEFKYNLIKLIGTSQNSILLKPEGEKAANDGIEKYLENLEYLKTLSIKANEASINSNKISKISLKYLKISIGLIIISIIVPFSLYLMNKNMDANNNTKNKYQYRQDESNETPTKGNYYNGIDSIKTGLTKTKSDSIKKSVK